MRVILLLRDPLILFFVRHLSHQEGNFQDDSPAT
jgi:hypothetical protein